MSDNIRECEQALLQNRASRSNSERLATVIEELRAEVGRLTQANAEDRASRIAGARAMAGRIERLEAANRQLEHTLTRIFIGDCLDPKETARAGLEEATRRLIP